MLLDTTNLFTKLAHHSLANVHRLVADNARDLSLDEMMALVAIQESMARSFISGNTNLAINDRFHRTSTSRTGSRCLAATA